MDDLEFSANNYSASIDDFTTPTGCDYNKGTRNGNRIITRSIKELGCCRSVVADSENNIIVGSKVFNAAINAGIKKVVVVETSGDKLVVVKRTDILPGTVKQKEITLVDNISSEQNLDWDADTIISDMNNDFSFDPRRWGGHSCIIKELSLEEYLKDNVIVSDKKDSRKKSNFEGDFIQLSLF